MSESSEIPKPRAVFLWGAILVYAMARICQLSADRLPTLLIVVLHVVPPAAFALVHGLSVYRAKGILVFSGLCLGFGTLAESVSLRTGFPFGHYYFTGVMGPKVMQLPVLLALAYLGIGYVAWTLALLILGVDSPIEGRRLLALPLLASLIMMAWDLSMDPSWSMIIHAWVWQEGGVYFGVPGSNFAGWFFTAYLYYQAFALYCSANPMAASRAPRTWYPVISFYLVCALGNILILGMPLVPSVVTDPTGKPWRTSGILTGCVLVSLLLMTPFALLAWRKVRGPGSRQSISVPTAVP